jgi:predicted ATPase
MKSNSRNGFTKHSHRHQEPAVIRRVQTNWYVITGGPSSGKTTIVNALHARGYRTVVEYARHYIDLQRAVGRTLEDMRRSRKTFQREVLELQMSQESLLDPDDIVFLDRAIPDTLAYCRFLKLPPDPRLQEQFEKIAYRKIFILDLLPLVKDYARREDEADQKKIHELLIAVYKELRFPVVHVPVLPIEERVEFILANL